MKHNIIITLIILALITACGRYGVPVPPEHTAPVAVENLVVSSSANTVNFTWTSPSKNATGKDLKNLEGYNIYRANLASGEKLNIKELNFVKIGNVKDRYISELVRKKEEARELKLPGRKVKVDDNLKNNSFSDSTVKIGDTYIYKIVPYSSKTEGLYFDMLRLSFQGAGTSYDVLGKNAKEKGLLDTTNQL